ncbi:hypothetical protein BaRGS_00033866 [Batillaria attramentaria]|uniref:15-oxoprostaglandin 13-reductase n=1 Tax=Batillaria attramentaria TaxID=370345 RepID=A0ABD0JJ02_9CAEN
MATGKAWQLARNYEGTPKLTDFKLIEEKLPATLRDGEILVEALYLSVDPYMRLAPVQAGQILQGEQVARVKASKNPKFPVGSLVQFHHGWRTQAVISPTMENNDGTYGGLMLQRVPDLGGLSPSLALGVLGMPGLTAYFGLEGKEKEPKPGETVVVSGAAGAVGSVAGQIAKIKGAAKVIGSAGTDEKCDLLRKYGFDHVFNYKKMKVDDAMKKFAPEGVDLYFDNVGGDFSWAVIQNMKKGGRVMVCGSISTYNDTKPSGHNLYEPMIFKKLTFYGGRLQYQETITNGFEKMPEAFISLFKGANTGKAIVKVKD